LPFAPAWLLGVANHRGEVVPVVDLRRLVGLEPVDSARHSLLVVRADAEAETEEGSPAGDNQLLGILVDQTRGIAHLLPEQIREPETRTIRTSSDTAWLASAVRGTAHVAGGTIEVLNMRTVLASPAFRHYETI
jgi:chemotaxis signal transduction protein